MTGAVGRRRTAPDRPRRRGPAADRRRGRVPGAAARAGEPRSASRRRAAAARLRRVRSASGRRPPAASIASTTRAPAGSRTTPPRRTAPTTSTTITAAARFVVVLLTVDGESRPACSSTPARAGPTTRLPERGTTRQPLRPRRTRTARPRSDDRSATRANASRQSARGLPGRDGNLLRQRPPGHGDHGREDGGWEERSARQNRHVTAPVPPGLNRSGKSLGEIVRRGRSSRSCRGRL